MKADLEKALLSHIDGLIQLAFLLNGAAAAGFLTFIGAAIDKQSSFANWASLSNVMISLAAGLMLAVLSKLLTLFAVNYSAEASGTPQRDPDAIRMWLKLGDMAAIAWLLALAAFTLSAVAFACGVLFARHAIFG